jgi:23S rRNA G2069 N7-methylase RlmK/C1962 C5-methylase RlmI
MYEKLENLKSITSIFELIIANPVTFEKSFNIEQNIQRDYISKGLF